MKNRFYRWVSVCLLMCFCLPVWAQDLPEAETFLWKVSGKNIPGAYLLGTVHFGKENGTLPQQYARALAQSRMLVVESDADDIDELPPLKRLILFNLMGSKQTLAESLGSDRIAALQAALAKGNTTFEINGNDYMKPWVTWISLYTAVVPKGYSLDTGIDALLIGEAKKADKPVVALETVEPMADMAKIPAEVIQRGVDSFIRHHEDVWREEILLIDDYHTQQVGKIWRDIQDSEKQMRFVDKQDHAFWTHYFYEILLKKRNRLWMGHLNRLLPKEEVLIAVGAAHLFGKDGLISYLRQAGYAVEPVGAETVFQVAEVVNPQ